jgi:hypothetical protein
MSMKIVSLDLSFCKETLIAKDIKFSESDETDYVASSDHCETLDVSADGPA